MRFSVLILLFAAAASVAFSGCEAPPPATTAVTGTVTLDGQPLTGANVIFLPLGETKGNGGMGQTNMEGKFTAQLHSGQSLKSPPGLLPGAYKVVISKAVNPDGTPFVASEDVAPIDANWKELVPEPYPSAEQTTLQADIGTSSVELNYQLRSKR